MLKNIPDCISPELMSIMMRMGHGDELVLADGDFPVESYSKRVIRADGLRISTLLEAILRFFSLDPFVEKPIMIMAPVDREPEVWKEYRKIVSKFEKGITDFEYLERFDFYKRAKEAFAVVATSEPDGNLILKKGTASAIL